MTAFEWGLLIVGVLFLIGLAFSDDGPGLAIGYGKKPSKKKEKADETG